MQYIGIMITCAILTMVISIILICFREFARKTPINYIMLLIFTLSEAYMVSFVCGATGEPELVVMAALMTAVEIIRKYLIKSLNFF